MYPQNTPHAMYPAMYAAGGQQQLYGQYGQYGGQE